MLVVGLTLAIMAAYAGALWWLLRQETRPALLAVAVVTVAALAMRLVYLREYPPGLDEDEVKTLGCAVPWPIPPAVLLGETCTGNPMLLTALFQAPLVPWLPGRWAIRLYSLVTNVATVPVGFAAARALGLRVAPGLGVAGLLATLPWALFFGRMYLGEVVFHQLLTVAGLARLVFAGGGVVDALIAAMGQSLLMYDYFAGRAFAPMALVAAVLARGRRRVLCLAVLVVALVAWVPHLRVGSPNAAGGVMLKLLNRAYLTAPLQTFADRSWLTLLALGGPYASDGNMTVGAGAMHPPIVLALAVTGVVIAALQRRRVLAFLAGGFLIGIGPTLLAVSGGASAHRLIIAYPFIALAAGVAFDRQRAWLRRTLVAVCVTAAAVQSAHWYFSATMWPARVRPGFGAGRTAVMEALPTGPAAGRLIIDPEIGYWKSLAPKPRQGELWTVDNWLPPNDVESLYAFAPGSAPLNRYYTDLLGAARVHDYDGAFIVRFEAADWTWLRRHGWTFTMRCGDDTRVSHVPALWHIGVSFPRIDCREPTTFTWRGRWEGPEAALRLRVNGAGEVTTPRETRRAEGENAPIDFVVVPGDSVHVTLRTPPLPRLVATLVQVTDAGEVVPPWGRFTPD